MKVEGHWGEKKAGIIYNVLISHLNNLKNIDKNTIGVIFLHAKK